MLKEYCFQATGNPFATASAAPAAAAAAPEPVPNILDLFGMSDGGGNSGAAPATANTSGGSDLLQLSGNPFANIVNQAGTTAASNSASSNAALNNGRCLFCLLCARAIQFWSDTGY